MNLYAKDALFDSLPKGEEVNYELWHQMCSFISYIALEIQ